MTQATPLRHTFFLTFSAFDESTDVIASTSCFLPVCFLHHAIACHMLGDLTTEKIVFARFTSLDNAENIFSQNVFMREVLKGMTELVVKNLE